VREGRPASGCSAVGDVEASSSVSQLRAELSCLRSLIGCQRRGRKRVHSHLTMAEVGVPPADFATAERPIVMVSGCYDLLHTGHAAFFADASQYGNLYVSVGNDANIVALKNHSPMFPENERLYMVRSIRHVKWAAVCPGMGYQDWEADLDIIKPDVFFVNEDGDRPAKKALCDAKGIKYVVSKRDPAAGLEARSSTSIKAAIDASKK